MTDSKKRLSIITINYNNAEGLQKTFESVLSQRFSDYEYIVIDGGSDDGSKDLINNYSSKINYWVSEKDNGVYHAMNKGIARANGEYCYFLNSGDFLWNDDVLERLFSMNITEDIVYGNMIHGGINTIEHGIKKISFYDFFTGSIYHQSAFIKRALFDLAGLYDEQYKVVSDWLFFLKAIFIYHCSTRYIDLEIAYYETGGLSFRDWEGNLRDRKIILEKYFPLYVDNYEELKRIKQSDLAGVHRFIENNKPVNKLLRSLLRISRFSRFRVFHQKRKSVDGF